MFAQLGTLVFENQKSFTEFSQSNEATFAEHNLLDGKPRLQRTGSTLNEINLSVRFHASFCNPTEQLDILKGFRDEGEILPLLWGNGKVEGDFVIIGITETMENTDPTGNVFCYLVNIVLKEFVTPDKLQQEQQENIKKAKATGDKKPVAKKKTNPSTCPQLISKLVNSVSNHAAVIDNIFTSKGGPSTVVDKSESKRHLAAISKLCGEIQQRAADPGSCVSNYPDCDTKATAIKNEVPIFSNMITGPTNSEVLFGRNYGFQAMVKELKAAARPLITQSITRK